MESVINDYIGREIVTGPALPPPPPEASPRAAGILDSQAAGILDSQEAADG
jgi:hypothetical protein